MKIQVIKIGKPAYKEYETLVNVFQQRMSVMSPVESLEIKASHGIEKSERALFKAVKWSESEPLMKTAGYLTIGLDERGQSLTSPKLAQKIELWQNDPSIKGLSFVVGGPMGLSSQFKTNADMLWSLSPLVMPSDMAWLMVWEQIYRAFSILKGTAYHHE